MFVARTGSGQEFLEGFERNLENNAPPTRERSERGFLLRTDDRFHLTGPSLTLDPRVHAYRKDIADIALAVKPIETS